MSAPKASRGASLSRYNGSAWDVIGEVIAITPPGPTADTIDTTQLQPTDGHRTFIKGLIDGGEVSVSLNFDANLTADAENQALLKADVEDPTIDLGQYAIEFWDGGPFVEFFAVPTSFPPGELTPEGKIEAAFTGKVSGKPTWGAAWAN